MESWQLVSHLDTSRGLVSPGWVTWRRVYHAERPETPNDSRNITKDVSRGRCIHPTWDTLRFFIQMQVVMKTEFAYFDRDRLCTVQRTNLTQFQTTQQKKRSTQKNVWVEEIIMGEQTKVRMWQMKIFNPSFFSVCFLGNIINYIPVTLISPWLFLENSHMHSLNGGRSAC